MLSLDFNSTSRIYDKIYHINFVEDNGRFTLGTKVFDSMIDLIQYFKMNPINRDVRGLTFPINEDKLKALELLVS